MPKPYLTPEDMQHYVNTGMHRALLYGFDRAYAQRNKALEAGVPAESVQAELTKALDVLRTWANNNGIEYPDAWK